MTLAVAGETVTDATGIAVTVTDDVPDFPSLVAVIVAVPVATPVTTPLAETVAMPVALELHVIVRPVRTLPFASFVVAVKVVVCPTMTLAVDGATVTVATGAGAGDTVTVAVPDLPSLVAVIVAVPVATPVTTPALDTVATAPLLVLHVTTRSVTTVPF